MIEVAKVIFDMIFDYAMVSVTIRKLKSTTNMHLRKTYFERNVFWKSNSLSICLMIDGTHSIYGL